MDIRVGEKVSGVIKEIKDEGYTVALCNDITGFAPNDNLANDLEASDISKGSEVKVRVEEESDEEVFQLTVTKLFPKDKFQTKPDKYLKNVTHEKNNGGDDSRKPGIADQFEEWLSEVDRSLDEINEHRKERLNRDFWTI